MMIQERVEGFFAFARERHSIYLRRQAGEPWPWTDDPILRKYKFTNVFRELDRTTVWFRENVRDRMRDDPAVLLATVVFRWFCKQEIGEIIFNQELLFEPEHTPLSLFLETGDPTAMETGIRSVYPKGPFVTGSYMLRSPDGMDKLSGMLHLCSEFREKSDWKSVADKMMPDAKNLEYHPAFKGPVSIENFTRWLQEIPGMGPFLAYEVATDLRHTALLENAPDIMTWANVGPGCCRGLNRLSNRENKTPRRLKHRWGSKIKETQALAEMRELLDLSQREYYWPQSWPAWEMREVEMWLCEHDKISRARNGEGTPKQLYRRAA